MRPVRFRKLRDGQHDERWTRAVKANLAPWDWQREHESADESAEGGIKHRRNQALIA
jgi:hypothetical protein